MSDEIKDHSSNPLIPIAQYCAGSSVGIVAIAFFLLHNISEGGMWAIAAMAAAPSLMGLGIAYFICKYPQASARQGPPSV